MFEKFTGQESTGVEEYVESEHYHGNLAQLGVLVELKVKTVNGDKVVIGFDVGDDDEREENPFKPKLAKARSLAREEGFDLPSNKELDSLEPGDEVKVAALFKPEVGKGEEKIEGLMINRESFWVTIKKASLLKLIGVVDNKLVMHGHGLEFGDPITFSRSNVLEVWKKNSQTKNPAKTNPWWPFDGSFDKTTIYHVKTGAKHSSSAQHKGYTIYKAADGTFMVPALDRESRMDTVKDARKFIDAWAKKNPGPIASTFGKAQAQGGKLFKYVDGQLGKIGGKLLKKNPAGSNPTLLCCSEDGRSMYLVGGDQRLNLEDLGLGGDFEKDSMVIGDLLNIVYQARKKFDKFQEIHYTHKVGEESGDLPILRYDRLNERLYIDGGKYTVEDVGIVN